MALPSDWELILCFDPHSSSLFFSFLFFFEVDFSYIRSFAGVFTYQSPFQLHVKDQHSSGASGPAESQVKDE